MAEVRKARGVSQRELAAQADVSFRGLQLLERGGHNWRVMSVARVAEAFNLPGRGLELLAGHFLRMYPDSVEDVSIRIVLDGGDSWKTHLFNLVDAFRGTRNPLLLAHPPITELEDRLRALCASTVEALSAEVAMRPPPWCAGIAALPHPWFVAGIENLKAEALAESPAWFRARNIFVLSNFLNRA